MWKRFDKKTRLFKQSCEKSNLNAQTLGVATKILKGCGVVAYPTEYCYGLGCDPMSRFAVERILQIKKRHWSKGLIVIASDLRQLSGLIDLKKRGLLDEALSSWPGPHTWVFPALPRAPKWICGAHNTIAVRITDHPIALQLCRNFRSAIVSTSANRSSKPPLRTHHQATAEFGDEVDFVLKGSVGRKSAPSTIRDVMSGQLIRGA
ncbi:MAG: threonylcarbamoyl-AMP synthase [Acidiferrobacteraceae bacterium]|jgi:L-threonylcarbamoyladenylate synthase|nr:threonylcarbamoyl-AMP synthase [Acidiferrobacteraceae bacterium]